MLRCTRFHSGGSSAIAEDDVLDSLRNPPEDGFVWLEVPPTRSDVLRDAARVLDLPRLAVANAAHPHQHARVEHYPDCDHVILKVLSYTEATSAVGTGELIMFLTSKVLITVVHGPEDPTAGAHRRAADHPELFDSGPRAAAYLLADTVVDAYLTASAELRADLTRLEQRVFAPGRDDVTEDLYALKREVLTARDAVEPLLPVAHRLVQPDNGEPGLLGQHFRDVAHHVLRAGRDLRSCDELLTSALDAQFSRAGLWQNEDMRKISAWAAIALVPTIVGGVYGMNFEHMPELHWAFGYPLAIAVILAVCGCLYAALRHNRWL
ncbi:magnesium and cobalt transport protein CorA [Saccharopolyspora hirsuta]|uniref:Magnesium and cobalt transport protein CorA n=1 Tax=Saccharopolyspora hirsuta TaxID=1837 RepID=A0A5M7C957_SACHI|nr:magnesium and cobalt transport protein CorA [Saccharopolyspora hirsuta]KAA5836241.1 magnesium and cobalt transport protein CorA [Saccharopolyspora hirsuta]